MTPQSLAESVAALRVFPLPGAVLLPGASLPLHVFEPRYRQLVADALAGDQLICVPQILEEEEAGHLDTPALYPYAAVGRITTHRLLPDGRYNIVVEPVARVRLVKELESATPYRVFEAELLLDAEGDTPKVDAVGRRLIGLLGPVLAGLGPRGAALSKGLQALPSGRVPAAVAPLVVQGAMPRQEYLAENDQVRRAQLVETMLLTRLAESRPATAEA